MLEIFIRIGCYLLAILMITSAIDKIKNYSIALSKIKAYQLVNQNVGKVVLIVGICIEIFVGISLLIKRFDLLGLSVFVLMMLSYSTAIYINLRKGNTSISCGCGGVLESDALSYKHLLRNSSLIITGILIYQFDTVTNFTIVQEIFILMIAISTIIFYGSLKEYKRQVWTIEKIKTRLSL